MAFNYLGGLGYGVASGDPIGGFFTGEAAGASGDKPYDAGKGPFSADNWKKSLTDPGGFAKGILGMGEQAPSYDANGELKKSEAMAGQVYAGAMGQTDWIAQHAAPGMNANIKEQTVATPAAIQAQNVNAPSAFQAQTIGTPSTLQGADADQLRQQRLQQAAVAANSPSSAAAQMRSAGGQIAQQQMGQAAMARGADRATARRDAMLATGTQGMNAANASAALAAQEQAQKQQAYTGALAGVQSSDVNAANAQTAIGQANQGANLQAQINSGAQSLQAQQANQAANLQAQTTTNAQGLQAAQGNQAANLQAQTATTAAQQAGWNAQVGAINAAFGTALQGVGAQNQAQGTAATYGANRDTVNQKQQGSLIGAGGGIISGLLSDENAKTDLFQVGGSSFADKFSSQLSGAYGDAGQSSSPYGGSQNFLDWKPEQYKAPEQQNSGGLLGGLLSDERAKRDVDAMAPEDIADWAENVPGFTYRYKPGIAEAPDDGERFHAGTGANALEQTGSLGKMFVTEGEDGLKKVDYGPMAFFHSKGALARADQALELAAKAYELALKGSKRGGKEAR